jgi:hypothetical protein
MVGNHYYHKNSFCKIKHMVPVLHVVIGHIEYNVPYGDIILYELGAPIPGSTKRDTLSPCRGVP